MKQQMKIKRRKLIARRQAKSVKETGMELKEKECNSAAEEASFNSAAQEASSLTEPEPGGGKSSLFW